jgi:hypothetical protein
LIAAGALIGLTACGGTVAGSAASPVGGVGRLIPGTHPSSVPTP